MTKFFLRKLIGTSLLLAIFACTLQAQSLVDYEGRIEICYAGGDTIPIFKDQVSRPMVKGEAVILLPVGWFDYTGRPPSVVFRIIPDSVGYTNRYHLRQDLSTMLGGEYDVIFNKATSPDSIFYRNPRNSDTLYYNVYGYTNDSITAIYKNKHVD